MTTGQVVIWLSWPVVDMHNAISKGNIHGPALDMTTLDMKFINHFGITR